MHYMQSHAYHPISHAPLALGNIEPRLHCLNWAWGGWELLFALFPFSFELFSLHRSVACSIATQTLNSLEDPWECSTSYFCCPDSSLHVNALEELGGHCIRFALHIFLCCDMHVCKTYTADYISVIVFLLAKSFCLYRLWLYVDTTLVFIKIISG